MKKILIILAGVVFFAGCSSNVNTVNVPADSSKVEPAPHDTATNMRDSAKNADTATRYK